MTSQQTTRTVTVASVILESPTDWDEWIEVIKLRTIAGKIWKFVDPYTRKEDLPALQAPDRPRPTDVNPTKAQFLKLDENQKEEL